MKTLLAILFTLALTLPAFAQDWPPDCDPTDPQDPECPYQQCPRDGSECGCTLEPDCPIEPPPKGTPMPTAPPLPTYQPGTVSILIPVLVEGWYTIEWFNNGKWWLIVDNAHPNGIIRQNANGHVELIGRAGQDPDPNHYRLLPYTTEPR